MKTLLPLIFLMMIGRVNAQITTPVIRSGFGVDGDLRANFFNGFVQSGNDDWYNNGIPGTGQFVIDTTGAAAIRNGYATDVSPFRKRMSTFYRTMSRPSFTVVNNRLWLDALFIRDYHGNDTTVFVAGSDKNGMSPSNWSGGVQGIPDKNDILDMFMHVRRAGASRTDSLWFFGGLSLDNVTGNRYFDFEMYQTDIYFDRASSRWYGFGPDAGHTSWQFDAGGNVVRPGDIIFSAEYQSASLSNIEARIWVHRSALATTPAAFSWSGQFDGDGTGAQYGYASILPKNGGTFYTGLQSGSNEWAGPFQLVLQSNAVVNNYTARQFMEFSVNLTKLGLDPVTIFGTDICGTPFNRIVVKTRASASFTAELKDFVAPIDLFLAPRVNALADVPIYCGVTGASTLQVMNPSASSVYTWSTPNGNIVGSTSGPSVTVNAPGTYIVNQQLAAGCSSYAADTVVVRLDATCTPMNNRLQYFRGSMAGTNARLQWATEQYQGQQQFVLERSANGQQYEPIATLQAQPSGKYVWDDRQLPAVRTLYYRLAFRPGTGGVVYSDVVQLNLAANTQTLLLYPNPAGNQVQLSLPQTASPVRLNIVHTGGAVVYSRQVSSHNTLRLDIAGWAPGVYFVQVETGSETIRQKLVVRRN